IVTICSGLYLFIGMAAFPPSGFSLIPLGTKSAGHVRALQERPLEQAIGYITPKDMIIFSFVPKQGIRSGEAVMEEAGVPLLRSRSRCEVLLKILRSLWGRFP